MSELRRGPWTLEEDSLLIHYIACHGEGRWDMVANCSGLRRTGKSCRLRWLNYLKPDVKRGNLSLEEQVLILELHSKWGNRWSRIAQHLPGRTDNEIKNYWRTRVQKQARQLKIDANSMRFREVIRCFWMPRLIQKIEENSRSSAQYSAASQPPPPPPLEATTTPSSENCSPCDTSYNPYLQVQGSDLDAFDLEPLSAMGAYENSVSGHRQLAENDWIDGEMTESMWNMDEFWLHESSM